jgi:hypothetical protein
MTHDILLQVVNVMVMEQTSGDVVIRPTLFYRKVTSTTAIALTILSRMGGTYTLSSTNLQSVKCMDVKSGNSADKGETTHEQAPQSVTCSSTLIVLLIANSTSFSKLAVFLVNEVPRTFFFTIIHKRQPLNQCH